MDTSLHASDGWLELYALRRLSGSEVEQIEEHLLLCRSCLDRLEEIGTFALAMRNELKGLPAEPRPRSLNWFRWLPRRIALAGALAVALLGVYWVGRGGRLAPLASLQLTAMRGEMPTVGRAREIDLTLTDAPPVTGPFRVEVVDASGARVWSGTPQPAARGLKAKVGNRLSPGDYFVRLFGSTGRLLHEYGFHVRG